MAQRKSTADEAAQAANEAAKAQVRMHEASAAALEESANEASTKSADANFSTYVENPNPNPMDLRPAPGPSVIQHLGEAKEE